jgi:hypothetical protein
MHVGQSIVQQAGRVTPQRSALVPTIFHEPWWLEIASDGAYREATLSSDGVIVGRLPYLPRRRIGGQTTLTMPAMTHVLGPALANTSESARSLRQFNITRDLIHQLPQASHIWFRLHRGISDTLAFEAAGFATGVDYTTEVMPDSKEKIWLQMRDKTRNVIRRARETLTVEELPDSEPFLEFYDGNLRERGLRNHYDRRIYGKLIAECVRRRVGRILVTRDQKGDAKSGIFTIWDNESEYYLMSTRTLDSKNGATSLLIWTAIQHAAQAGLTFNTDGLDSKTNLLLLTGFGGSIKPRFFVRTTSNMFLVTRYAKKLLASGFAFPGMIGGRRPNPPDITPESNAG